MENHKESSLMKKTKKELVEIILRKDDVENRLRKEKADIELDFNKAKEMIDKKDSVIDSLNSDIKKKDNEYLEEQKHNVALESAIDDLTSENTALRLSYRRCLLYIGIMGVAIILAGVYFFVR